MPPSLPQDMVNSQPLVPENKTLFRNRLFVPVIKLRSSERTQSHMTAGLRVSGEQTKEDTRNHKGTAADYHEQGLLGAGRGGTADSQEGSKRLNHFP